MSPFSICEALMNAIPSAYKEVSRTSTYHIYATIPIFLIYTIGNVFLNTGERLWVINGAEKILFDAATLFGMLPPITAEFLFVATVVGILYIDRQKYGLILPRTSFFSLTLAEALFFGLAIMTATSWVTGIVFYFAAGHAEVIAAQSGSLSLFKTIHAFGSGFYEELLYRVILLGGVIALFRIVHIPGAFARIAAVVFVAILSAWLHYTGPFQDSFAVYSFLYRVYGGVFFSAVYLRKGFATAAWSHAIFDIAVRL